MKAVARRRDQDRRRVDQGPPSAWKHDRRNRPDRRAMETIGVEEASFDEFVVWKLKAKQAGSAL